MIIYCQYRFMFSRNPTKDGSLSIIRRVLRYVQITLRTRYVALCTLPSSAVPSHTSTFIVNAGITSNLMEILNNTEFQILT